MADSRISVRLDAEIHRRLDEAVTATGKSESELVREALAAYLQQRSQPESCLDLARQHDLIGCARQLPPDLSTNPKHFKGFGE
jgi:Arc/MetJ-type ribon-helix-helix transcriptional regulator